MGQYRLWLHYREIDQQLHKQLATLKQEANYLQEQTLSLENNTSYADNMLIQALIRQRAEMLLQEISVKLDSNPPVAAVFNSAETSLETLVAEPPLQSPATQEQIAEELPAGTASSAFFARSALPNFGTQEMQEPLARSNSLPSNTKENLLPEDISAFVDAYTLTTNTQQTQIKLPWWLRNTETANTPIQTATPTPGSLIDQQSVRTNQVVNRWFERWERHSNDTAKPQEDQA